MLLLQAFQRGDNGRPITATEAAIRAGYPPGAATEQASWIMSRPNCRAWLDRQEKRLEEKHGITMDMIVGELAKLGFSNMADYVTPDERGMPAFRQLNDISRDQMAAVTELTVDTRKEYEGRGEDREQVATVDKVKFKLAAKTEALINIAKLLGYMRPADSGEAPEGGGPQKVVIEVVGGVPKRKPRG